MNGIRADRDATGEQKKVAGLRYSIKNYVKEKYSFAREIAFSDLRESENWKDMPKVSELDFRQFPVSALHCAV